MRTLLLCLLAFSLVGCCDLQHTGEAQPPDLVTQAPQAEAEAEVTEPKRKRVRRITMTRIDVDVVDADLEDVMDDIGRQVGQNILVHPDVHETVTVTLRDIPWREAVELIAKMTRCEIEVLSRGSGVY